MRFVLDYAGQESADFIKANITMVGGAGIAVCVYQAICLVLAVRLKSLKDATSQLLQVMNLATLPLGIVLIAAGALLASQPSVSTLSALPMGLVIFGCFMFLLCLMGSFAAAMEARMGLMIYGALTCVFSVTILSLGIFCFTSGGSMQEMIVAQWDELQKILPADFATMTEDEFAAFIATNLNACGFVAIVIGATMILEAILGTWS